MSTLRFASLGSGSDGNATLVQAGTTTVMIDCGFGVADATRRLQALGMEPEQITRLLVTHEHQDHLGGVGRFARKYGTPVQMTVGTWQRFKDSKGVTVSYFDPHTPFTVGDLNIQPFPVPHDCREPAQFVVSHGEQKLGVVTDVGSITPHMCAVLTGLTGLVLECNHDLQMLAAGPYPESLQRRVGGDYGHLNNQQAQNLLASIDTSKLQQLVLAHLSDKNNTPELATAAAVQALGSQPDWLHVACQEQGFDWRSLSA